MTFKEFCNSLEEKIKESYNTGVSLVKAEELAAEFLYAQLRVSQELKNADLDSRMKKSGLKSIRAAIYLDIVQKADKRPTEAQTAAMVDNNDLVAGEQQKLDISEVERDDLERYYNIFREAHLYYRSISKGKYE